MILRVYKHLLLITALLLILSSSGCQLHLQGQKKLAKPLQRLYLETSDPYGYLARVLRESLTASNVILVDTKDQASTVLHILQDTESSRLLSVSGTQQTRQYKLIVTVMFEITDTKGRQLLNPQSLSESRVITEQSNQILGSSNEVSLFYQQMRRSLTSAIINRLASKQVTALLLEQTAVKHS